MSPRPLLLSLAAASFAACASRAVPLPTAPQVESAAHRWPGTTEEDLDRGRTLYVERCSGCHTLPAANTYRADGWPKVIEEMSGRAKLNDQERTRVLRYLVAVTTDALSISTR